MTSAFMPPHVAAAAFVPASVYGTSVYGASAFADPSHACLVEADMVVVDVERREDAEARESLLDRAFGPARFAKTCERLRAGRLPATGLSLVARTARSGGGVNRGRDAAPGEVVGTIRLWHVDAGGVPALMLGPLAVDANWRCHRVGARLMASAIDRAGALGHAGIVLVGDAPYYARFGFERRHALGLRMPGPVDAERFLGLELVPGALEGANGLVRATGVLNLAVRRARRSARRAA